MKEKSISARIMTEGFNHFGGKHCETSSLKKVLDYHGLNLSEEMLLGLGGGIGFIYWFAKGMPAPFSGMRNGKVAEILIKACKRMGVKARVIETGSARKGYSNLKEMLSKGEPAIAYGDMAYLPYFGMPEEMHFGGHAFVIYGIDENGGKAWISDRCANPLMVGMDELEQARNSKHPPFPPKNRLLEISHASRIGSLEKGIREGINDCCNNMLHPPIKNIGLEGIKKWAGIVPSWAKCFSGRNLLGCLFNVFLYIEIGGTGGSGFRKMYAQFLREAGSILRNPALRDVAGMFEESGEMLSAVADAALPDDWPSLKRIRELSWEKDRIFLQQDAGAKEEMTRINEEMDVEMKEAAGDLGIKTAESLLSSLEDNILKWHECEAKAFKALASGVK